MQLAVKLLKPARLLLLDEVTADLDVASRCALLQRLGARELRAEGNRKGSKPVGPFTLVSFRLPSKGPRIHSRLNMIGRRRSIPS